MNPFKDLPEKDSTKSDPRKVRYKLHADALRIGFQVTFCFMMYILVAMLFCLLSSEAFVDEGFVGVLSACASALLIAVVFYPILHMSFLRMMDYSALDLELHDNALVGPEPRFGSPRRVRIPLSDIDECSLPAEKEFSFWSLRAPRIVSRSGRSILLATNFHHPRNMIALVEAVRQELNSLPCESTKPSNRMKFVVSQLPS